MKSSVPQILYTEDDADTRELISFVLTQSNCKVVLADNNDKALRLARNNQFDLYIIDNWMPGGSGIDLCRKLREFDSSTPILFYSGAGYERDKQEAFASGAQAYLTKPSDNEEVVKEVFRLISEARTKLERNQLVSLHDSVVHLKIARQPTNPIRQGSDSGDVSTVNDVFAAGD